MYRQLHATRPDYQEVNQGIELWGMWTDKINSAGNATVLEIGCGNGILCDRLAKMGYKVDGIDIVDGPYKRDGYDFWTSDVVSLYSEIGKRSWDYVLCFDVLEHLPEMVIPFVLGVISKLGKYAILAIPSYGIAPLHLTVHTSGWWLDNLIKYGDNMNWTVTNVFERDGGRGLVALFYGTAK